MTKFKNLLKIILEDRETERLKIPDVWKENLPVSYRDDLRGSVYKAIDLVEELNKDKWYTPEKKSLLLYRGVDGWNQAWMIKNIRKDREPRDTRRWVDGLIERVRRKYYSEIPSRRASKFAASSKKGRLEVSNKYGHPHVVFPEEDAPVYSISKDPMHFMKSIGSSGRRIKALMNSIVRNSLHEEGEKLKEELIGEIESRAPEVWEFAKEIDSGKNNLYDIDPESTDFEIDKHPLDMVRSAEAAKKFFTRIHKEKKRSLGNVEDPVGGSKNMTLPGLFSMVCQFVGELFDDVHAYFANLSEGVVAESGEVMYSGDSFVRVEWRFWKFFIDYDFSNGEARLHQLVRSVADENSDQLHLNI